VQRTAQWRRAHAARRPRCALVDWIEPLLRRESYLALLLERPSVHERLLRLLGGQMAGTLPAAAPRRDRRAGRRRLLAERFDRAGDFERAGGAPRRLQRAGEDDDEEPCSTCCAAPTTPKCSAPWRATWKGASPSSRSPTTSALADIVLRVTMRWCWPRLRNRTAMNPQFAIIGYGKLGGKELGYGSDLDIVFVYDDDDERAPTWRGLFGLRAQADQLADRQDRRGRPVRDRHRAAPQRQLGPAGDQLRGLRQLPAAARQQHRLDLGAPGHDARALCAGAARPAAPL
jgi:glutamate-ammonia-ligase adenylyltransferase